VEYCKLGRTGITVSKLCLGTLNFGERTSESEAQRIFDAALDAGVNFFDSANTYGRGTSERILGKALKKKGKRDSVVLATKFHGSMDDGDPNARGNSRRHIITQCDASLARLQTDYIDLYQIHRPTSDLAIDEPLRALDDLVRSGKVRYIGTSMFPAWQIVESLWASRELGLNRIVSEQPPYNLLERRIERELLPMAKTHNIALLPWAPLAEGFLSGKYSQGHPLPSGRLSQNAPWFRTYFTERAFAVLENIQGMATEKGCTVSQLSLAWCLRQPGITSPIIGPRTVQQLYDNVGAVSVKLACEDFRRIDMISPPAHAIVPYYEADFGPTPFRW
jgi:aryl-alcohol dehydrogenase-like predicted oxidoreductase